MPKKNLAIIGVGMMGGSIGLAVKKKKLPFRVLGVGRNLSRLKRAQRLGACDDFTTDIAAGAENADLVVICTALNSIIPTFESLRLKPSAIVTDIGSVKAGVMKSISDSRFIGGHPLAGSEKTGAENANPHLYENATVVLCPGPESSKSDLNALMKFWKSLGAKPLVMDPQIHDILTAQTSHLPHVLASAFASLVAHLQARDPDTPKLLAGSFKDLTRIVDSDSRQWAEICAANQKFLIGAVKSYRDVLLSLLKKLESSGNPISEWEAFFLEARAGRKKLLK